MKKDRGSKKNDPEYIDIFAEDDDIGESAPAGSLFDEEDGPVSSASEKKSKSSGGLFSRKKKSGGKKKASRPAPETDDDDDLYAADEDEIEVEIEEEEEKSRRGKKRGLFSRREKDEPEEADEDDEDEEETEVEIEEEEPRREKKRGLFSRREEEEAEETDDWELDEEGFDEEEDEDGGKKRGFSSLFTWSERDEDEEPSPAPAPEPVKAREEKKEKKEKKKFSLGALFSNGEDEDEDEPEEDEDIFPEKPDAPEKKRPRAYVPPALNKDEDWDIGGDFSDPFAEADNETEREEVSAPEEEPGSYEDLSFEEKAESFSFDRYGRRKDRAARTHYGRRKNAKKATTTVVTNETDTLREEEEARLRAQKRDVIRDREIEKRKQERRVNFLRELKQRLTVAGLLGILTLIVLLAAYFAFRVTGIDVSGVCTKYSSAEIVEMSGLKRGRHILFQDLSEARDRLNADPYLNASVRYVFPNKINIVLTERTGVGAVQWGPNSEFLALIDTNGYVLETDLSSKGSLPVVKGLVVTRVVAGTKIGDDADEQVQSTLDVLRALNEFGLLYSISTVDISETMGISMYTPENYRIELGNVSDLNTKLNRLKNGWRSIMNTAADQMKKPSVDNVTIYLYAKSGVVVSPHGIGYVDESRLASETAAMATPEPVNPFAVSPEYGMGEPEPVYYEPAATPEPVDIIPNFNDAPFTG